MLIYISQESSCIQNVIQMTYIRNNTKCNQQCTQNQQSIISYDCILIEIDITKPLPTMIKYTNEKGVVIEQKVTFNWVPLFCPQCQVIGHVY